MVPETNLRGEGPQLSEWHCAPIDSSKILLQVHRSSEGTLVAHSSFEGILEQRSI